MKIEDKRADKKERITGHNIPRNTIFTADSIKTESGSTKIVEKPGLFWKTIDDWVIDLETGKMLGLFIVANGYESVKAHVVIDE